MNRGSAPSHDAAASLHSPGSPNVTTEDAAEHGREIHHQFRLDILRYLPAVLAVGIGLTVSNAKAVMEAVFGIESEFTRTPKYGVEGVGDDWRQKRYRGNVTLLPFVELLMGLYFTIMMYYAASNGIYGTLPFIVLFQAGFLHASAMSLFQNLGKLDIVREQEA